MTTVHTHLVETERARHAVDVTDVVSGVLPDGGFIVVSVPHTTCALVLSEPDADLLIDIEHIAAGLLAPHEPFRHARHANPNAAAHIMSSMFGTSLMLRVDAGRLCLGTWQRVVLIELDGPKQRTIEVSWSTASGE